MFKQLVTALLLTAALSACGQSSAPNQPPGEEHSISLTGTVYAPDGGDVAGTVVVACFERGEDCDEFKSRYFEVTTSGESAAFSLPGLEATSYNLFAAADNNGDGELGAGDYLADHGALTPPKSGLELRLQVMGDATDPGGPGNPGDPGTPVKTSRFFLPTAGEVYNTTDVTVETDAAGGVHMVYPSLYDGDAFYAYCPADCAGPERTKTVIFETDGTVYNAMLALTKSGKPRVLLSGYNKIYYASCDGDCTQEAAWTQSVIFEHTGDREVSGEAFALDAQGRPRFIMHAYRAYLGINQPDPATFYATCDVDCHAAANWQVHKIADQIWQESQLRFNAQDGARLATVAMVSGENGTQEFAAYLECDTACTAEADWVSMTLTAAYSDRVTELIDPAISMVLTSTGTPRVFYLATNEAGVRTLLYAYCDTDCTSGNWGAVNLGTGDKIGAGLDLALDGQGRPRAVYTYSGSVVMSYCDTACENPDTEWDMLIVENANDIPPDQIPFPYCSYGLWSLRHPSLSIAPDGLPRVAYQAEDISAGNNPNPNEPDCDAGVDLSLSRFTQLASYE